MATVNISNKFTSQAMCKSDLSKEVYYDALLSGFILEVRSTGNKTFYYSYSENSKRTMRKLGNADTMTADQARRLALKMKKAIAEGGLETLFVKKTKTPTMQQFYNEYYLPYVQKHVKSHKANVSLYGKHILPVIGNMPMDQIKKMEIMKLHMDMVHKKHLKPATANKCLIFISQAFHLAIDLELSGITVNPAKGIKLLEVNNERQRFLTRRETKVLLQCVQESDNRDLQYIIPMLILSGCRLGELLKARRHDFDLVQMMWTIPTSKNGRKRTLPITSPLYEIYKQIPHKTSPYIFPSPKTNKPYITIHNSWKTARAKAGLPDVRMHDLRHSYASALVNAGRSLYEVQTLLGHSSSKMTQRYAHLSNEALMSAASCAGRLMG